MTLREILLGAVSGMEESYRKPACASVRRVSASDSRKGALRAAACGGMRQGTEGSRPPLPLMPCSAALLCRPGCKRGSRLRHQVHSWQAGRHSRAPC